MQWSIIILLLGIVTGVSGAEIPDWVRQRPVNPAYYIGIGVASKSGENREYIQQAKNAALSDLASEITVNITSDLVDIAVEQSGLSEEMIRSEIRTSTEAELEDYELVDTWENKREYWVYYRLSRVRYQERLQNRISEAVSLAKDYYRDGENAEDQGEITDALGYYLRALLPLQPFYTERLETEISGTRVSLKNELISTIQGILSRIELSPLQSEMEGKIGKALANPLAVRTHYRDSDQRREIVVKRMPLEYRFLTGEGVLQERIFTNGRGIGSCRVSKITGTSSLQMVQARVDLFGLLPQDTTSVQLQGILRGFSLPTARFILRIEGMTVYVDGMETNFGESLEVPALEPILKSTLADRGFTFVDEPSGADLLIQLEAVSRKGSVVYGQHVAYVDLSISVQDLTTGKEIEKRAYQDVKGIHLDYERAGLKAYEHAGEKISGEFVPTLLEKIQ